jgi:hypothetical protein
MVAGQEHEIMPRRSPGMHGGPRYGEPQLVTPETDVCTPGTHADRPGPFAPVDLGYRDCEAGASKNNASGMFRYSISPADAPSPPITQPVLLRKSAALRLSRLIL